MYETTYVQAKANGFVNCPEHLKVKLDYLREVANTLGHDMSSLDLSLVDAVDPKDKRALNKLLFTMSSASVPVDRLAKFREIMGPLSKFDAEIGNNLKLKTRDEMLFALTQAQEYHRAMSQKLDIATSCNDKLNEINGHKFSIIPELEKVLRAGFWSFHEFIASLGVLEFATTNEVVMVGSGTYSDIKLAMGYYKVTLTLRSGALKLQKFKGNRIYADAYYHPYCSSSGDICFGNSTDAANKMRASREYGKWFELLANLLCYYDQNSNPYVHFSEFVRIPQQGSPQQGSPPEVTADSDDCCGLCSRNNDSCECHYCEACAERYPDGGNCSGNFCPECSECHGGNRCEDHYCWICNEYSRSDDGCANDCCTECDRTDSRCRRCRECGMHGGDHAAGCDEAPEPEPEPEPTF